MTRLAVVRYLNTAPLVEGLEKLPGVRLIPAAPSAIAGMVDRGEADVGLVSLVDAVRLGLALVPVGMIGCDGPTLTVRVFSSVPIDQIRELHADPESHTSVVLAQILLAWRGVKPRIVERDGKADWPEAVLLIGDKVVNAAPPRDRYPHELDLGDAWKAATGMPFVYAMWACRADRVAEPIVSEMASLLDRQRRHNATRLEWIVRRRAAGAGWPEELALRYVRDLLRYTPTPESVAGMGRFVETGAGLGLLPEGGLRWAWGVEVAGTPI